MTTNAATRLAVGRTIYSLPGPSVRRRRRLSALPSWAVSRLRRLLRRLRLHLRSGMSFRPDDLWFGPED